MKAKPRSKPAEPSHFFFRQRDQAGEWRPIKILFPGPSDARPLIAALERLEAQGIARPSEEAVPEETRQRIAEVRRQAEAKLAELEILHRDKLARLTDFDRREEQEEYYLRERRRIEEEAERKVGALRAGA